METIGIVLREGLSEAAQLGLELVMWCRERSIAVLIDSASVSAFDAAGMRAHIGNVPTVLREELVERADPIVTLGGDGTLLTVARLVNGKSPAMIGVNFGHLGFLTEISPHELFFVLERHLRGENELVGRTILAAAVEREGKVALTSQAVNEVAILKGVHSPLPMLEIRVGKEHVMSLRADGVLIATPVGSTAYSLSAGGSIVHPGLEALLITPLCPHSLTIRPLVLPLTEEVSIFVPKYEGDLFVVIDGHMSMSLRTGDAVSVKKSPHEVRFVRSPSRSYFEILRRKLNWGRANREDGAE